MNKLLTIVVPVYKVEKYINKCLDSCVLNDDELMNQLEVIIVNDGTPDRSAELSREYTVRYPQTFRQFDKENGGHGSAWNVGLKEATGKYLRFLDSDDWLSNLDMLMQKLVETDADLVFTDYTRHYMDTNTDSLCTINSVSNSTLPLSKKFLYEQKEGAFTMNFWRVTYKTSILKPLYPLFAEKILHDDSILESAPLLYGKTYIYYDFVVYNYLLGRPGQSMDPKVMKKTISSMVACQIHWKRFYEKYAAAFDDEKRSCVEESMRNHARYYLGHMLYLPYKEAKKQLPFFISEAYPNGDIPSTKLMRRYKKYPFFIFYYIEQIRLILIDSPIYLKLRKAI